MAKELFTINNRSLASNFLSIKDIFLGSVSGRDAARKSSENYLLIIKCYTVVTGEPLFVQTSFPRFSVKEE